MTKIDITKTELVWPGKYNEDGTRREVPRVSLPFQVIETVNESRATREVVKRKGAMLFDTYQGTEGDSFEKGWRNKLIWGDNLLVMGSLLEKFAGKVDLIYIDPPFATGVDFSFSTSIGEGREELEKQQSIVEEHAYRDTWGRGSSSYLDMMLSRLRLMHDLLSPRGSIYVHCDYHVSHLLRCVLEEVFGAESMRSQIAWKSAPGHSDSNALGVAHNVIHLFTKSPVDWTWNSLFRPYDEEYLEGHYRKLEPNGRKFEDDNLTAYGLQGGGYDYEWKGVRKLWRCPPETMKRLEAENRLYYTRTGVARIKRYLDEMPGAPLHDLWTDIARINSQAEERIGYDTQKPEALLDRIIKLSSSPGDLVADFFSGSGTTVAVAEKLGRRWIASDLGRWSVHVTRKRLLGIEACKPFEVLNLGKYERQYWQGVTFGESKDKPLAERALYEYLAFVLKLYGAHPVAGMAHLHGRAGRAMVHIGAVDAPVTFAEVDAAVDECATLKQTELHILGWEWEMGLVGPNNEVRRGGPVQEVARHKNVKLLLLQIPREVMEQQPAAKGDVRFFELAYLEAETKHPRPLTAQVALKDFVIPNTELIPEEVRNKVKKWSDYIDYWAVDWDFQNDTFMQGWVAYRTRQERKLPLASDTHKYVKAGKYRILVKVIDIFGNDTSQAFVVEVK
jgi:adenine-specific DNA-methyltransferase